MKMLNFLKIGIRLTLIIAVICVFGIWGMIAINKNLNIVKENAEVIIKERLRNKEILTSVEKYISKTHHEIAEGVSLYQFVNESIISQKVSSAGKNLELAKVKLKTYQQNLQNTDYYEARNPEALFSGFNMFYETSKGMMNYLAIPDSVDAVGYFYLNRFNPALKNLEISLTKNIEEVDEMLEYQYNISIKKIEEAKSNSFIQLLLIIILLIVSGVLLERSISKPLKGIIKYINRLSLGELPDNLTVDSKDEVGLIKSAMNKLVSGLKKTANFANQIGEGNLDIEFQPLSEHDILGNSLLDMRKGLQKAKYEELKRKAEDDKRNWTTLGLAKFGDILRKDNDNLSKLANDIMGNLIEYINANQGGLFIYNDEEEDSVHLELVASYAYNRKKFLNKNINIGEGLIGTCALEKETIYMTEIPGDYIEITSGLGDANPRSLLIVPLKLEENIFGIIELASFSEFEPHQIEFVEKIGESIASTLSSVKINAHTASLLDETKLQAEEMATKEEEMRQNLEELKATQEEMERIKKREAEKTTELLSTMEEQRKMLMKILDHVPEKVFLKDKDGNMLIVNSAVAKVHQTTPEELIGKNDFDFFDKDLAQEYRDAEIEIMTTGAKTFTQKEDISGEARILQTTKMPFYISHMKQTGLLGVQIDITELNTLKEKEDQLMSKIEELEKEIESLKKNTK